MKCITVVAALALVACARAPEPEDHPLVISTEGGEAPAPNHADERLGNVMVRDANGAVRTYNTTVDVNGVHTSHVIVDSMPAIDVGGVTVGTVDQGDTNASHAQAWKVLLSDGSAALGSASNPIRTSPATSPATQPVSASSLPLPTGAATEATLGGVLTTSAFQARIPANGQAAMAASVPVAIASNQSTLPVSAASLPLPSGAATAAKQPALGTAGSASADVLTVQGIASMTALKVDGSAVTQPVSASSLPLPTGAATESTLSTLSSHVPANGQATMSASIPVVVASNQSAISTSDAATSSTGSAVPAKATYIAGSSGGTEVGLKVASDGTLQAESQPASASAYITQISCTSSAARIDTGTSHAMTRGFWLTCDSGGGDVYAGGSGVTTSNGFKIAAGQAWFFEETNTNNLYFISSTGTVKCYVYGK